MKLRTFVFAIVYILACLAMGFLLSQAKANDRPSIIPSHQYGRIHINHHHTFSGDLLYDQLLLEDWEIVLVGNRWQGHWVCKHWAWLNDEQWPTEKVGGCEEQPPQTYVDYKLVKLPGRYRLYLREFNIDAGLFYESWTQDGWRDDPEIESRVYLPKEKRDTL